METGVIIDIRAIGTVVTPKIYNVDTGEHIFIDITLSVGDRVQINTIKGQKSIIYYPALGGSQNIIGKFVSGSTWLQLIPGDNIFTITADTTPENMNVTFSITDLYEGV